MADITGKSAATCKEYRFEENKSIPLEVYKSVYETTTEILTSSQDYSGALEKPVLDGAREVVIEEADRNDVVLFDEIDRLSKRFQKCR